MKKFIALLACSVALQLGAQNCNDYEQFNKGVVYTMTNYDGKDKVTSTLTATVNDVTKTAAGAKAEMTQVLKDGKGKETNTFNSTVSCDGGTISIDMKNMASQAASPTSKDMNFTFEGSALQYPSSLTVGATLADGTMKMTMSDKKSGTTMSEITTTIADRKVVSKESITTTAGTFECYKITYTLSVQNVMFIGGKTMTIPGMKPSEVTEWYSPRVGAVRSETRRGDKLESYTVLTELKK